MSDITVDQMVEFFLYAKEVNAIVANQRSLEQNRLLKLITTNDLTGVKLVGGNKPFRTALSAASTQANGLYPNFNGPTLLCNLPKLLGAVVKLFTPLFPPEVRRRLKFERGIMNVENLSEVLSGEGRATFLSRVDEIVYEGGEW